MKCGKNPPSDDCVLFSEENQISIYKWSSRRSKKFRLVPDSLHLDDFWVLAR